jgi:phosphoribosylformimino-5-aminoimidazole carboxamide ribonucleotide (ProFAR) isomerase
LGVLVVAIDERKKENEVERWREESRMGSKMKEKLDQDPAVEIEA